MSSKRKRENLVLPVTQAAWINKVNARNEMLIGGSEVFCSFLLFEFQITFHIKLAPVRRPKGKSSW